MAKLDDVVNSLIKPMAGPGGEADRQRVIHGLDEYSSAQRQRGVLIILLLLLLLAAPLALTLSNVQKEYLPYLLGGTGLFAAGTVKMMLSTFQDISRAHTLAVICQGLNSKDAKDVLANWLKGRT